MLSKLVTLMIVAGFAFIAYIGVAAWKPEALPSIIRPAPPPPKTPEKVVEDNKVVYDSEQVAYFAGIIRHSFRSNPKELLLVALAAKNTAQMHGKDYKWVFAKAAEMVPPWSSKTTILGVPTYIRVLEVVKRLASSGEWAQAESLAVQVWSSKFQAPYAAIYAALTDDEKNVTTYYRPEGNKNPQSPEDLELMKRWEPKVYTAPDGAFWLRMPREKPAATGSTKR